MVSLYVNFQLLALSELFRADWALVILDVKMDLFVRFHDMLVKEALSAALKWAFELPLCRVLQKVAFQVIFVATLLSTSWTDDLLSSTF